MIKLLVVDDSALMRRMLSEVFGGEPDFEVRIARDGVEGLAAVHAFQPDVVTLDVQMPHMDGLACLDRIMLERPCPVVMLSSLTREGADETLRALSLGAVDFLQKPGGAVSLAMDSFAPGLIDVVRRAAKARVRRAHRLSERVRLNAAPDTLARPAPARSAGEALGLVLVGASTGGPPALDAVLGALPEDFPWAVLVAQHMPASFTSALARRLDSFCPMSVVEVDRAAPLAAGRIYIARGGADLIVSARPDGLFGLCAPSSAEHHWHPSVDRLVESACAHVPPDRLLGVLLTGMGDDGARSMAALREAGGRTIAEAEDTAIIWGMPGSLVRLGGASVVAPLGDIAAHVVASVLDPVSEASPRAERT